jgi:hypothetical protein
MNNFDEQEKETTTATDQSENQKKIKENRI